MWTQIDYYSPYFTVTSPDVPAMLYQDPIIQKKIQYRVFPK